MAEEDKLSECGEFHSFVAPKSRAIILPREKSDGQMNSLALILKNG